MWQRWTGRNKTKLIRGKWGREGRGSKGGTSEREREQRRDRLEVRQTACERCGGRVTQKQNTRKMCRRRERQKKGSVFTALLAAHVPVARLPSWVKVSQEQQ